MNNNNTPTLNHVTTDLISKKTTLKNSYGSFDLEEKFKEVDGEYDFFYSITLKLQGLRPEVASEVIRTITPFFEDPVSPQLTLFPAEDDKS
jgi:hypothetical protein